MKNKKCLLLYIIFIITASIPLMNDFLIRGHDIYFHLMRIEGLAQGMQNGQFPVKIQPVWYDDYGYAVSVFYGDLFVYLAAFLRLLGFSLQNAYKGYLVFCNMATLMIAGYSFGKIFQNPYIGAFGGFLYSMSAYRLVNLYTRGAVGEYTGMMFLPLLIYACVLLLDEEKKKENLKKGFIILGVSMACILQSHILTAEIVCMVLAGVVILYAKRVFCKEVLLAGIKAVAIALVLSTWFLVPFLDYMLRGEFNINSIRNNDILIQRQGVFLSQVFAMFDNAIGQSLDLSAGTQGDFAQGAGLGLMLAIPALLVLFLMGYRKKEEKKNQKLAVTASFVGLVMVGMSTIYFPWDTLCRVAKIFQYIIVKIQFPWRFTGVATAVLALLWCTVVSYIWKQYGQKKAIVLAAGVVLVMSLSAGHFMMDLLNRGQRIQIHSVTDMDSFVASGEEYLLVNTVLDDLKQENLLHAKDIEVSDYIKAGTTITFHAKNAAERAGRMELPLLYYEGYRAIATREDGTNIPLEISAGQNNVVSIELEAGMDCDVTVGFCEPWYWRMAEIISVMSLCVIVVYGLWDKRGVKSESREKVS